MTEKELQKQEQVVEPSEVAQQEVPQDPPPPSKRDDLRKMLSEEIPDYNLDDDEAGSGQLMDYIQNGKDQRGRLAEALQKDPRLAQVLADVASGKRGAAAALARYFGKDALMAEEGTEEYDAIIAAEEERKNELDAFDVSKKEYDANIEQSMPVLESWCQAKGVDMEQFMESIWEKVINPIMQGIYSEEMLELLDKGLNYDKDTQDAMAAGEIKGRNTNINKMREDVGDGMPKSMPTSAPQEENRKRSSFIQDAMKA